MTAPRIPECDEIEVAPVRDSRTEAPRETRTVLLFGRRHKVEAICEPPCNTYMGGGLTLRDVGYEVRIAFTCCGIKARATGATQEAAELALEAELAPLRAVLGGAL